MNVWHSHSFSTNKDGQANVLVKEDLRCCLADFGLSLVTESQIFDTTSIGQRGAVRWMAPELFAPSKFPKTEPSLRDIYAFGCTILEVNHVRSGYQLTDNLTTLSSRYTRENHRSSARRWKLL